jgi:hypothetical protein
MLKLPPHSAIFWHLMNVDAQELRTRPTALNELLRPTSRFLMTVPSSMGQPLVA